MHGQHFFRLLSICVAVMLGSCNTYTPFDLQGQWWFSYNNNTERRAEVKRFGDSITIWKENREGRFVNLVAFDLPKSHEQGLDVYVREDTLEGMLMTTTFIVVPASQNEFRATIIHMTTDRSSKGKGHSDTIFLHARRRSVNPESKGAGGL